MAGIVAAGGAFAAVTSAMAIYMRRRMRAGRNARRWWNINSYNTSKVIGQIFLFYEAQESGKLRRNHRVKWRGDSYLNDGRDAGLDLTGGWEDAGDHLKLMFPLFWSVMNIAWGMADGAYWLRNANFQKESNYTWAMQTLLHGLDFMQRCHYARDKLVIQVGEADVDHSYALRSELDNVTPRTVFVLDRQSPGSDAFAMCAAAFAASALALSLTKGFDKLTATCLRHARELYEVAEEMKAEFADANPEYAKTYRPYHWQQYMFLAAAWLYRATGDRKYRKEAFEWKALSEDKAGIVDYSWSTPYYGAVAVLYGLEPNNAGLIDRMDFFAMSHLLHRNGPRTTPGGLTFVSKWGSLRHAAGNAAILAIYARYVSKTNPRFARQVQEFAEGQICYILGGTGRSYIVGFGVNPPKRPHHRNSALTYGQSGNWELFNNNQRTNPFTLQGALVGGPSRNDKYEDKRTDYIRNEVALDYDAALLIGMLQVLRTQSEIYK